MVLNTMAADGLWIPDCIQIRVHKQTLNQNLRSDADRKFDDPHTVEMTDVEAPSPPQLTSLTVKTKERGLFCLWLCASLYLNQ